MIDLHLHTYYSDGTLSPRELVLRAKQQEVSVIAITDHDGVKGISEAREAGKKYGVQVIAGIEFSAAMPEENVLQRNAPKGQEIYMHILGYGIDPADRELNAAIDEIQKKRRERNEKMLKALKHLGYELEREDFQVYETQEYIGKPNFARALVKKGYAATIKEAFSKGMFLGHPEIKSIHRAKIDAQKAIHLIHQAGGIAVLAHPLKISYQGKNEQGSFFDDLQRLLEEMKALGLDGMECYYNNHLIYETERLLQLADRQKLLVSAGTDFHGPELSDQIEIGKFPCEPEEMRYAALLQKVLP